MKRVCLVRTGLLVLAFWLVGCGLVGTQQFNADGSEASPFTFEYPASWEIINYKDGDVYAIDHVEDIEIGDDGELHGFNSETNIITVAVYPPERMAAEYGDEQLTPLAALEQRAARAEEVSRLLPRQRKLCGWPLLFARWNGVELFQGRAARRLIAGVLIES